MMLHREHPFREKTEAVVRLPLSQRNYISTPFSNVTQQLIPARDSESWRIRGKYGLRSFSQRLVLDDLLL
jgi:hypothetical protein